MLWADKFFWHLRTIWCRLRNFGTIKQRLYLSIQIRRRKGTVYLHRYVYNTQQFNTSRRQAPINCTKILIEYKDGDSAGRSIRLFDNNKLAYIGASVLLNGKTKLTTDTGGRAVIPSGLKVTTVRIAYVDVKDTTIVLNDQGKGDIEISMPGMSYYDIQSDLIIKDWLIRKRRMHAVENDKVSVTFFLKKMGSLLR